MSLALPPPPWIARHFTTLIGRDVEVEPAATPLRTGPLDRLVVAWFVGDDRETVCGAIAMDYALAAGVVCALAILPPSTAAELARTGAFTGMNFHTLHEVMNISSRFIQAAQAGPALVAGVGGAGTPRGAAAIPQEFRKVLRAPAHRADFAVNLGGGFGQGTLMLATL